MVLDRRESIGADRLTSNTQKQIDWPILKLYWLKKLWYDEKALPRKVLNIVKLVLSWKGDTGGDILGWSTKLFWNQKDHSSESVYRQRLEVHRGPPRLQAESINGSCFSEGVQASDYQKISFVLNGRTSADWLRQQRPKFPRLFFRIVHFHWDKWLVGGIPSANSNNSWDMFI